MVYIPLGSILRGILRGIFKCFVISLYCLGRFFGCGGGADEGLERGRGGSDMGLWVIVA